MSNAICSFTFNVTMEKLTCSFVKVLVVDDDAVAQLRKIQTVSEAGAS